MVISILGCGWYGKALASELIKEEITVNGSVTSAEKSDQLASLGINPFVVNLTPEKATYDPEFFECDVLVISIPPKFKSGQSSQYLPKIHRIIEAITKHHIYKVIYISSTGVYGDLNSKVNELTEPLPDTELGNILLAAEKLLSANHGFKTTILRCGGLVGPGRHPGRFFAGKQDIPNGRAPVNLIHLDDCVGITLNIIQKDTYGYLFNACSTDHPAKADFYGYTSAQAGLPLPQFVDELKGWKIIDAINPTKILSYNFEHANWLDCDFL